MKGVVSTKDEYAVEQHDAAYFIKRISDGEYLQHLHFGDKAAAINYVRFGLEGSYIEQNVGLRN